MYLRLRSAWLATAVLGLMFAGNIGCDDGSEALLVANDATPSSDSRLASGGQCDHCPSTATCCDGFCIDTRNNEIHCGMCNNACRAPRSDGCSGSVCVCYGGPACSESETCCAGAGCRDLQSDADHCGACGIACGPTEECVAGACVCAATGGDCEQGTSCCVEGCVDTNNSLDNCGSCGTVCGGTDPACVAGTCVCSGCPATARPGCCGDGCVDLCTDGQNCGACGVACPLGLCLLGSCDGSTIVPECLFPPP